MSHVQSLITEVKLYYVHHIRPTSLCIKHFDIYFILSEMIHLKLLTFAK